MDGARIVHECETELDVLHLLGRVFAVPGIERDRTAFCIGHDERQLAGGDDGEATGLIAWVYVGEVGDAVARHVVMVESLAELLRGIDLIVNGAAGLLLHGGAPFFQRLLQRMRWRYAMRQLEFESLFLSLRAGGAEQHGGRGGNRETGLHAFPPMVL